MEIACAVVAGLVGAYYWALWNRGVRERFSCLPLGLSRGSKKEKQSTAAPPKLDGEISPEGGAGDGKAAQQRPRRMRAHAMLSVKGFGSWMEWAATLGRSPRSTMVKQIDKAIAEHGLVRKMIRSEDLGFAHWLVIMDHESRVYGRLRGILASFMRFLVAKLMVGMVDEFYIDGRLVAFANTIVKGRVLRGMWFYQRTSASRCMIWFWSLRLSVDRAIESKRIDWVDLGPSYDDGVATLKTTYGSVNTLGWRDMCDYSGDFWDIPLTTSEAPAREKKEKEEE